MKNNKKNVRMHNTTEHICGHRNVFLVRGETLKLICDQLNSEFILGPNAFGRFKRNVLTHCLLKFN